MKLSKQKRRESAQRCAVERAKRTDVQQIDHLDRLLGVGCGAVKERNRLWTRINARPSRSAA